METLDYGKTKKTRVKEEEHEPMTMVILPRAGNDVVVDYDDEDDDDEVKVKKAAVFSDGGGGGGSGKIVAAAGMKSCQADKCGANLTEAKVYHRRHKVCEVHAKAQVALVSGFPQRFCQQCSRFHELSKFDDTKRSCRSRLAGHNERRRKISSYAHAVEGTSRKGTGPAHLKELVCGQQVDGSSSGRIQISIQDNATYKHFQIR